MARRDKQWKNERKCEGMRYLKEFKNADGDPWAHQHPMKDPETREVLKDKDGETVMSPTLWQRCTDAANEWLGLKPGHNEDELREKTWENETPVGFNVTCLSPAVRMCP